MRPGADHVFAFMVMVISIKRKGNCMELHELANIFLKTFFPISPSVPFWKRKLRLRNFK